MLLGAVFEAFSSLLDVLACAGHSVTSGHDCECQHGRNKPYIHDRLLFEKKPAGAGRRQLGAAGSSDSTRCTASGRKRWWLARRRFAYSQSSSKALAGQSDEHRMQGRKTPTALIMFEWLGALTPTDTQDQNTQRSFSGMQQPGLISVVLPTIAMALCGSLSWAEDPGTNGHRKVLAESVGGSVPRACIQVNCGTVLAVRRGGLDESPPPTQVQGALSRQPPFGRYDPHIAPVTQPSFLVQKHTDTWVIEVRRRDGTIQSIEQNYPALFQVGDEVLVEGDRVRAPD
jgi:hypothetical protein